MQQFDSSDPHDLALGDPVEVRIDFDVEETWSAGFSLVEVNHDQDGHRIRRECDGFVLPAVFHAADLRPARNVEF